MQLDVGDHIWVADFAADVGAPDLSVVDCAGAGDCKRTKDIQLQHSEPFHRLLVPISAAPKANASVRKDGGQDGMLRRMQEDEVGLPVRSVAWRRIA